MPGPLQCWGGPCCARIRPSRFLRDGLAGSEAFSALKFVQFEMLCASNHTACRFAEKVRFFRSLRAGQCCAVASRISFFKGKTLYFFGIWNEKCGVWSMGPRAMPSAPSTTATAPKALISDRLSSGNTVGKNA